MADMPIQVNIEAAIVGEEVTEENDGFVKPFEVRVQPFAPRIAVGFLLDYARLFDEGDFGG
jgi:hypothetical protein